MKLTREEIRIILLEKGFSPAVGWVYKKDKAIIDIEEGKSIYNVAVFNEITGTTKFAFPFPKSEGDLHRDLERAGVELPPFKFKEWWGGLDRPSDIILTSMENNRMKIERMYEHHFLSLYYGREPLTLFEAETIFLSIGITKEI
jgi:hypothetical protein